MGRNPLKLKYFLGDIVVAKYKYDDQATKRPNDQDATIE
jgi:hypothetical protein